MKFRSLLSSLRLFAGVLLATCLLLPLYSQGTLDGSSDLSYSWTMISSDFSSIFLLALAYLWPVLILFLLIGNTGIARRMLATVLEPILLSLSVLFIVTTFTTAFSWQPLFSARPGIGVLVSGNPEAGSWLGLSADALYLLTWMGLLLSERSALNQKK
jgi:hypothetical protein